MPDQPFDWLEYLRLAQELAARKPECTYLGQIALRLKEKRERADYKPVYRRIQEDVAPVLTDAQDFAARLGRLAARHPNTGGMRR